MSRHPAAIIQNIHIRGPISCIIRIPLGLSRPETARAVYHRGIDDQYIGYESLALFFGSMHDKAGSLKGSQALFTSIFRDPFASCMVIRSRSSIDDLPEFARLRLDHEPDCPSVKTELDKQRTLSSMKPTIKLYMKARSTMSDPSRQCRSPST